MTMFKIYRSLSILFLILRWKVAAEKLSKMAAKGGDRFDVLDYACILLENDVFSKQARGVELLRELVGEEHLNGLPEANLSLAYSEGLGVLKDDNEAEEWLDAARLKGFSPATNLRDVHLPRKEGETEGSFASANFIIAWLTVIPIALIQGRSTAGYLLVFVICSLVIQFSREISGTLDEPYRVFFIMSVNVSFVGFCCYLV